jgi:hypothetical protein
MKVRKSIFAALALVALSAAPSFAASTKLGLGYFRPEAPVGGRAWVSEKIAIDLGVGFSLFSPDEGESESAFVVDGGVPIVLQEAGNAKFFLRPGFTFASSPEPTVDDADNKLTQFWVSGSFGVEYFFTDNFSIQAAHGVLFKSVDPDAAGGKYTEFVTEDFGVSNIGFHFYFN